ncbi:hypothetical protein HD554DRAFT_2040705 [Boletus coccyginus]|nr:hypothetical protein HD554DRAFT_2040705 [Boletus coccyginus]
MASSREHHTQRQTSNFTAGSESPLRQVEHVGHIGPDDDERFTYPLTLNNNASLQAFDAENFSQPGGSWTEPTISNGMAMMTNPHGSIFDSLDDERELESSTIQDQSLYGMSDVDQRHGMTMSTAIQDQTHCDISGLDKRHGIVMSTAILDQTQHGASDQRHGMAMFASRQLVTSQCNTITTPGGQQATQIRTPLRRESTGTPITTSFKSTPEPEVGNGMTANFQVANGDAEADRPAKKAKAAHERSGRMLSADDQHVVSMAYSLFKCKLAANNHFPDITGQVEEFVVEALTTTQQKMDISVPMEAYEINLKCTLPDMDMICQNNCDLVVLLMAKSSFAYTHLKNLHDWQKFLVDYASKMGGQDLAGEVLKKLWEKAR